MEAQIRELRLTVDKFINSTSGLNPSREVSLCHTSLQRSKAWLGEVLRELGSKNPYPDSTNPQNSKIEPQAEHKLDTIWSGPATMEGTQTAHVKFFRQEIGLYQSKFDIMNDENPAMFGSSRWGWEYWIKSREAMIEAKHWLGWELDRIRKQKEGTTESERKSLPL
jgi:hypothetical protein